METAFNLGKRAGAKEYGTSNKNRIFKRQENEKV